MTLTVFTRNHEFYVLNDKNNEMRKVSPEKIVHPQTTPATMNEVFVK